MAAMSSWADGSSATSATIYVMSGATQYYSSAIPSNISSDGGSSYYWPTTIKLDNKKDNKTLYVTNTSIRYRIDTFTDAVTGYSNFNTASPSIYIDGDSIMWDTTDPSYLYGSVKIATPEEVKRQEFINRIRSLGIVTRTSKALPRFNENTPEGRARGLLREMIGNDAFARYLRRGSVTVVGPSGLHYVIYGSTIRVFAKTITGKMKFVESICIVFKGHEALPPTDHVIMRLLMAQADEFGLRSIGNKCPQGKFDDVEPTVRKVLEFRKSA